MPSPSPTLSRFSSPHSVCPYVNVVVDVITTSAASAVSPPLSMNPPPFVPRSDPENYLRPVLTDVHTVGGHRVPRWSQPVPRFPEYLNVGRTTVADANTSYVSQLDGERRSHANAPSLLPRPTALEPPRYQTSLFPFWGSFGNFLLLLLTTLLSYQLTLTTKSFIFWQTQDREVHAINN
ncbi:unnamed protein product [Dibothriocephalus latus]|uniref:Uncharacterized protein n=1 Tax=Dibothriocephalus latus TaxID=60516 RepID=A0A3P7MX84_DIBLA|nr:unnamed protein product [Dibothriocephalus latus]